MALDTAKVGKRYPPVTATVEGDRALAYAAATNDDNPAYRSGKLAPPVFGVVPTWDALSQATLDLVPSDQLMMVVHGEQDMHFVQPLVPGQTLVTRAEAYGIRVGRSGTRLTTRLVSEDPAGASVLEQYSTMFVRGLSDGSDAGPDKPGHRFPEEARSSGIGSYMVHVDDDQTYRYRDASGDTMPIHVDVDLARSVGLPGIIVHGLCTMAMCSQAAVRTLAGGDPSRLKRLAVRFSKPVFPGSDIVIEMYDAGRSDDRHFYAFEAFSGADVVIKDGRAEVGA